MKNKLENFIEKSNSKHNEKYDYSNVIYNNIKSKVKIICKLHGEFLQAPDKHLFGQGCPLCGKNKNKISKLGNLEIFINKSNNKHNNKYDYSNVIYINSRNKVKIICKKHGEFSQSPSQHVKGHGCPSCGVYKCQTHMLKSQENFINESNIIHNNKYDYSKVIYKGNKQKVIIICKEHGEFLQRPFNHLCGNDCKDCSQYSKGELKIKEYFLNKNINFIREKTFLDCLSENNFKLRFDFYLPEKNIIIEYDGVQHFIPIKRFGGIEGYNTTIARDNIKNKYCKDKNIKLIRISYKDRKNIEKILNELFYINDTI